MIKLVTQGILLSFLLFFCSAFLSAEVRINPPIQLVLETDRNQLYQHAQLLVTLHIFHEDPLPEVTDIIPPQLEEGRVRTLGEPYTRIESGPDQNSYHTTIHFAVFPGESGELNALGPSLRLPSSFDQTSQILTTDFPLINVLPALDLANWLPSESLFLRDTAYPIGTLQNNHLRHLSITATAALPHQLPSFILDASNRHDYQLIERNIQEFNSRQGVSSQLTELWLVSAVAESSVSHPISSVTWWDTQSQTIRQAVSPVPSLEQTVQEIIEQARVEEVKVVAPPQSQTSSEDTPFWLQILIGGTLFIVVLVAALFGFRQKTQAQVVSKQSQSMPNKGTSRPLKQKPPLNNPRQEIQAAKNIKKTFADAEANAFRVLMVACHDNACHKARGALVLWAACFWPEKNINRPDAIYQANVSKTLNYLLLDLEEHIKQSQEHLWQGDLLLEAVKTLRRRRLR